MEAVSDLPRLRCSLTRALQLQAAAVAANDLDLAMLLEPARRRIRRAVREQVDDLPLLQVHDDRSVGPSLAPAPVVNSRHADGRRRAASGCIALQVPEDRGV